MKFRGISFSRTGTTIPIPWYTIVSALQWRHNGRDSVSNHQRHECLLNRLFRRRSKKTSKLRVTGLCAGNSPGTGEFPAQMVSYAENVSIWWRHHVLGSRRWLHFGCAAFISFWQIILQIHVGTDTPSKNLQPHGNAFGEFVNCEILSSRRAEISLMGFHCNENSRYAYAMYCSIVCLLFN